MAIQVSEDMHDRIGQGMDLFVQDELKTAAYVKLIDAFRAVAAMMGDAVAARVAALLPESPPDKEAPRRKAIHENQGYRGTNMPPKFRRFGPASADVEHPARDSAFAEMS